MTLQPVKDVKSTVEAWLRAAAEKALGEAGDTDPLVREAKDTRFGDYQSNLAMPLAKRLGRNPREVATEVLGALREDAAAMTGLDTAEVAGPGFINLKLRTEFLSSCLSRMLADERLGVELVDQPQRVVIDYSGPNLAKEMHVGHLRSTIIGDALCRVLAFRGDDVIRQNHLGDWGTQFGMLLEYLIDTGWSESSETSIRDLNGLYRQAKQRFDAEPEFAERSRQRVVALQGGQQRSLELWKHLIAESVRHMKEVYSRMGVLLQDDDIRPESFYNDRLPLVIQDLRALGLLKEDDGAQVIYPEGFKNKDGDPLPLIVQKRDGGYGYATTDLAGGRYRATELGAERVIYVVDARQADHFKMVFWGLRAAGWAPADRVRLEHVAFGTILGKDKKPFKSRSGDNVRLVTLLDEARARARKVVEAKNPDLETEVQERIAEVVAIGAVKYADLSSERIKDYVFDYERMLALEGNTAPYLQYAYARIQSIFREGKVDPEALDPSAIAVEEPAERALATQLLQLPRVVQTVASTLEPHRLCGYLYDLASAYHAFYKQCRVLNPGEDAVRDSRLALCAVTARTLKHGLSLLGIECVEKM